MSLAELSASIDRDERLSDEERTALAELLAAAYRQLIEDKINRLTSEREQA